ncbi:MAG: amidohydrolase [Pseudomonadota bacterium]|jgi:hippurate hydrolase
MNRPQRLCATVLLASLIATNAGAVDPWEATPSTLTERQLPSLVQYYEALHADPELSRLEAHTAADLARELRAAGFDVTEHLGQYTVPGQQGYGVVGILHNGRGPTVLIRADMDALPVEEQTGLSYASHKHMAGSTGGDFPVMHACGHDVHVTSMVGVARVLAALRDQWHGTLMLVGQPAEETIDGASALIRGGLYDRFPTPDYALALHSTSTIPAGTVGVVSGYALATSTSVDVTVRGVGGHGSRPEDARDPVVLAAGIVMQLQTIVSREISPFDPSVLTVGSIHGGTKRNIIPDEVKLELTLRTYTESTRAHMIQAVARIARAAALGADMPEDRLPIVHVIETEQAPALFNDPKLVARIRPALEATLGTAQVRDYPRIMGSEDFGNLGLNGKVPVTLFWLGVSDPAKAVEAERTHEPLPNIHSSHYAPAATATLRTGVIAMSTAALALLGR